MSGRRAFGGHLLRHGSNQLGVQLLLFVAGLLVVRSLVKDEFAIYALATGVLAAYGVLVDGGVSSVVLSHGASRVEDKLRMAGLMRSAARIRLWLALGLGVAASVWLGLLVSRLSDSWLVVLAVVSASAASMIPLAYSSLAQTYLRLTYRLVIFRWINLSSAALRLILVVGLSLAGVGYVVPFLLVVAALNWATALAFRIAVARDLNLDAIPESGLNPAFRAAMYRAMPPLAILIAFEQAFTWLITVRGGADIVAEFSALARFGVAFVVLNSIVVDLIAPRIARSGDNRASLLRRYLAACGAYLGVITIFVLVVGLASPLLLWLIGPQYAGLGLPLVFVSIGFALANFAQALNSLNTARGWLRYSWIYAPLMVVWAAVALLFFDFSNIAEVALVFVLQWLPAVAMQVVRAASGFASLRPSDGA